jgi:hypothetical protein
MVVGAEVEGVSPKPPLTTGGASFWPARKQPDQCPLAPEWGIPDAEPSVTLRLRTAQAHKGTSRRRSYGCLPSSPEDACPVAVRDGMARSQSG